MLWFRISLAHASDFQEPRRTPLASSFRVSNKTTSFQSVFMSMTVPSVAHIGMVHPDGGEVIEIGSTTTVVWQILVQHVDSYVSYDLFYSSTGPTGHFIPIVAGLAPGAQNTGSLHTYEWTVDVFPSDQMRIRVEGQTTGPTYFDLSLMDFSVVPLEASSRLRVLRLDTSTGDLADAFDYLPCTRISDLRTCAETPLILETYDDPAFPLEVAGDGDLVMFEFDSDLLSGGTADGIGIAKGPNGELIIDLP
jgi:hypothetical protein